MAVIVCPICATRYRVADSQLSQASRLKCKKCKTVFPVSDNIRDETSKGEGATQSFPAPAVKGNKTSSPKPPVTPPKADLSGSPQGHSIDFNLNDMSLDFGTSANAPAPELDFAFRASVPQEQESSESNELHDHIAGASQNTQGRIDIGLDELAFEQRGDEDAEATRSLDYNLDFSFSANIPEAPPEREAEGMPADADMPDQAGALEGLNLDDMSGEATVTMTGRPALNLSEAPLAVGQAPVAPAPAAAEPPEAQAQAPAEPLSTCCIDSLAMGLQKCGICGRDLKGREHEIEADLQLRKKQLKDELLQGEVQVGFSGESYSDETAALPKAGEDFTDVERALDALADGTFEKAIKKKESRKTAAKTMKLMGAGIGAAVVVVFGILWALMPTAHEKLVARYDKLMAQPELDSQELVALFLDAASKKDQAIFESLAVMAAMPAINSGKVVTVGNEYDETALGSPGKEITALNDELTTLKATYQDKEKKWQEESKVDLSPQLIEQTLASLTQKQEALQAEANGKETDSKKKLLSLQQDRDTAKQEWTDNRKRVQDLIDATDPKQKAMRTASERKVQALDDKIAKLEAQIREEDTAHRQRMEALKAEYTPKFEQLKAEFRKQQALLEKAKLLKDQKNSPLVLLDKELKDLKKVMTEKENLLKEKDAQLKTALAFFKRDNQKPLVEKNQQIAEFAHLSKNVIAAITFEDGTKQSVPVVLKRYRAVIPNQTLQGDWLVETILNK